MALSLEQDGVRLARMRPGRHDQGRFAPATACWLLAGLAVACITPMAWGAPSPFYMGADISLETYMQQQSAQFADNRGQAPLDTIMYDHGANLFRLRIFV